MLKVKPFEPLSLTEGKKPKKKRTPKELLKEIRKEDPERFKNITVNLTKGSAEQNISVARYSKARKQRYIRREQANLMLEDFNKTVELIGITKGQFSLHDIILELSQKIGGQTEIYLSTWNLTLNVIDDLYHAQKDGLIKRIHFLLDTSMGSRDPETILKIQQTFGIDSMRIGKNHSKITIIKGGDYEIVILCSMNLNKNPRFEFYFLRHDPQLYQFFYRFFKRIWDNQQLGMIHLPVAERQQIFLDM